MAHCADPDRLHSRSLVLLHAHPFHVTATGRQWFHSGNLHRAGGLVACADAGVSSGGEQEAAGGSRRWPILYTRWFLLAKRIVAGPDVSLSEAARRASVNRQDHFAVAKVDRRDSRYQCGLDPQSRATNQRWRNQPDP